MYMYTITPHVAAVLYALDAGFKLLLLHSFVGKMSKFNFFIKSESQVFKGSNQ